MEMIILLVLLGLAGFALAEIGEKRGDAGLLVLGVALLITDVIGWMWFG